MQLGGQLATCGWIDGSADDLIFGCLRYARALGADSPRPATPLRQRSLVHRTSSKMRRIVFFTLADKVQAYDCKMWRSRASCAALLRAASSVPAGAP